ncbi:hypothetical protein Syun_027951 [Stephania yunnanensis]|uniref:Uncharacterized protein n=1 Tax=Stephania yunnanensis TaxID=152371 RepID=A0AAP0EGH2_9MAGN
MVDGALTRSRRWRDGQAGRRSSGSRTAACGDMEEITTSGPARLNQLRWREQGRGPAAPVGRDDSNDNAGVDNSELLRSSGDFRGGLLAKDLDGTRTPSPINCIASRMSQQANTHVKKGSANNRNIDCRYSTKHNPLINIGMGFKRSTKELLMKKDNSWFSSHFNDRKKIDQILLSIKPLLLISSWRLVKLRAFYRQAYHLGGIPTDQAKRRSTTTSDPVECYYSRVCRLHGIICRSNDFIDSKSCAMSLLNDWTSWFSRGALLVQNKIRGSHGGMEE